ncbi:MAG: hypothetical protein FD188_3591, partial [Ignavibacteria bacterium]
TQIKRKHSTYIGRLLKRLRAKRHVHQKELSHKLRAHHNRLSSKSNTVKAMPNLITLEMANMLTAGGKLVAARLLQPVTVIAGPDGTLSMKTNPGNEGSVAEKIHCTYSVGIEKPCMPKAHIVYQGCYGGCGRDYGRWPGWGDNVASGTTLYLIFMAFGIFLVFDIIKV